MGDEPEVFKNHCASGSMRCSRLRSELLPYNFFDLTSSAMNLFLPEVGSIYFFWLSRSIYGLPERREALIS